jgi:hypothetical protein
MPTLRVEHRVSDYEAWKKLFDSDPADRQGSGVVGYRIARGVEDPNLVFIDLDLDDPTDAGRLRLSLLDLWSGPAGAMLNGPTATVVEQVESVQL